MTQIIEDGGFESKDFGFIFPPRSSKFNQPYNKKFYKAIDAPSNLKFDSTNGTSGQIGTFEIAANTKNQVNLEECYFTVSGKLYCASAGDTKNWKCSNDWFLSFIDNMTLSLSGVAIANLNKGNLYSNVFTALMHDRRDLIDGTLKHTGRQLNTFNTSSVKVSAKGNAFTGLTYTAAGTGLSHADWVNSAGTGFAGFKNAVFINADTVAATAPVKNVTSMTVLTNIDGTKYRCIGTMGAVGGAADVDGAVDYSAKIFTSNDYSAPANRLFNSCIESVTIEAPVDPLVDLVNFEVTIPLVYIFPNIASLYPVFNQEIKIEVKYKNNNILDINNMNVTSNVAGGNDTFNISIAKISQFYFTQIGRELSSEAQQQSLQYYGQGVQTEFTELQTIPVTSIIANPNSTETLTASISVPYSPSLMILCIPCANKVVPNHTSLQLGPAKAWAGASGAAVCYEQFGSNCNSLTHLGIESIKIETTNSDVLKHYNFKKNNGYLIAGTDEINKFFCVDTERTLLDYHEVYNEFKAARKFFGRLDEGAISYDEFLKEYFMFCVDLTSFGLVRGTKITFDVTYADVRGKDYRKYGFNSAVNAIQRTSEAGCLVLGRKLITYKGDSVSISDIFVEGQSIISPQ